MTQTHPKNAPSPRGFELREITWKDKHQLIATLAPNERVHPLQAAAGESELPGIQYARERADLVTHRLAPDVSASEGAVWNKHCYGLYEPGSKTPRNIVYVKLLHVESDGNGKIPNSALPGNIADVLKEDVRPVKNPNLAVFYSISSVSDSKRTPPAASLQQPERGLKAIVRAFVDGTRKQPGKSASAKPPESLGPGEQLIKSVAAHLQETYGIHAFTTLSPVRVGTNGNANGFAQWLEGKLNKPVTDENPAILTAGEKSKLHEYVGSFQASGTMSDYEALETLKRRFSDLSEDQANFVRTLQENLAIYYLAHEKIEKGKRKEWPLDGVAGFHVPNGAIIANIHWSPNMPPEMSDAVGGGGVMVNYRYDDAEPTEVRKQRFKDTKVVPLSALLRERHEARLAQLSEGLSAAEQIPPPRHDVPVNLITGCEAISVATLNGEGAASATPSR